MTIIPELASQLGRKDENPNKDLGIKVVTNLDLAVFNKRLPELTPAQEKRVQKILKKFS